MKVIIFGIGNYYREQKEKLKLFTDIQIVAFTDNDVRLWNQKMEDITIIPPQLINTLTYEKVLIMSTYISEIYRQLMSLGIDKEKIIIWEELASKLVEGKKEVYSSKLEEKELKGDVLIISTSLNYNGGSLAVVYGAMALKDRGMSVVLAAPEGNRNFIKEIVDGGLTVIICPALPYINDEERKIIEKFDIVLVNVFQMVKCAIEVNKIRPTLWWIHEPFVMYDPVIAKYPDCLDRREIAGINIYAVSKKAQENFNKVYPNRINKILQYGIPDMLIKNSDSYKKEKKTVFAIIGGICNLKSQDVFLNAVKRVKNINKAEFWIIGKLSDDDYCKKIVEMAKHIESVKLLGELSRKEVYESFKEIDVVVCTSQEEMLSIVITEAMMFGKICITTDHTGNKDYIQNGMNGFVIPGNDIGSLAEKMQWIIDNIDKMGELRSAARKTYEKYFMMDIFGKRFQDALIETKQKWRLHMEKVGQDE